MELEQFEEEETLNALNRLTTGAGMTTNGNPSVPHARIPVILNANVLPEAPPSADDPSDAGATTTTSDTTSRSHHQRLPFNFDVYFDHLTSNRLGHNVLYQEVSPSTQILIEPFTAVEGIVAIASQQVRQQQSAWR